MKIKYKKKNTKIINSYDLVNMEILELCKEIIRERRKRGLPVTRKYLSYVSEIKAHRRLYKLGLFRSRTRDTDLEEPINCLIDMIYRILGI